MAVFFKKDYKSELLKFMNNNEYVKASYTSKNYIKQLSTSVKGSTIVYNYLYDYNRQSVEICNNEVKSIYCDCYLFEMRGKCSHTNAVLYHYLEDMIERDPKELQIITSNKIFNALKTKKNKNIKKLCNISADLTIEYGKLKLFLKIGHDKMYMLKNKVEDFFDIYLNDYDRDLTFGKNFVYNSTMYYFSELDDRILRFAYNLYSRYEGFVLNPYNLGRLLELIEDSEITFNSQKVSINKDFYVSYLLDKTSDGLYKLSSNLDIEKVRLLANDFSYILYDNKCICYINKSFRDFLSLLYQTKTNELLFDNINSFKKNLLPILKNNIELTDKIDNVVVVKKPSVKLYFDLNYNDIILDPKFDYKEKEVSYFSNTSSISRDDEYEKEVVGELLEYGFLLEEKCMRLSDEDLIGDFIENGINKLIKKYEVFTSEKLKKTNVVKESHVKSTFSIGKDNIVKYTFDLGDISKNELNDIFDGLKQKKKYYKLKNGNYLNLNDENILELEQLYSDLNMKPNSDVSGTIPKYKAIYLDYMKKNKYNIIDTNDLFDKFINNFNNYKNSDVEFDKDEDKLLRDYQKNGVKWMYNIYKCDLGGILADEMGLGKSFQTLSFIKKVIKEKKDSKILIVTPTSLCYNWEKEIEKFASKLNYHVFAENRNIRRDNLENGNFNVYITSYGLLREDIEYYKKLKFEVMIIDEAQNIKNPQTGITKSVKMISANVKFALTGTPLENSLIELWSIFDFIMPGFFGSSIDYNKKYNIKDFSDDNMNILNKLNKQISPFILRRKKSDVIVDLPPKIENNIFIDLSKEQKEIYMKLVDKTNEEIEQLIKEKGFQNSRFKILELITRLRQVSIDPKIIYENYNGPSTKIDEAINIIKTSIENGHKILLFSSFRTALSILEKKLKEENINYYLIDGSVSSKKRIELVDSFNTDTTPLFLIMLKSGGTGLNLTSADTVIHLDLWWNPAVENQATDRSHRIGQKNVVEVIKIISKGTIEEKILELQGKKKKLSDTIIEGDSRDSNLINTLTEEDLLNLISNNNEK